MWPGIEQLACDDLAVPMSVMEHVVRVESAFNPFAIGVVGGRLVRQPKTLPEALATAAMLEEKGYNFSLGLAQVNRHNLASYGLASYEAAFQPCPNLRAGARILAECRQRTRGDWGKAFSCYYSGNAVTGFRDGYVEKVFASMRAADAAQPTDVRAASGHARKRLSVGRHPVHERTSEELRPGSRNSPVALAMPANLANGKPSEPPEPAVPAAPAAEPPHPDASTRDHAFVF